MMIPVLNNNQTYEKFLQVNHWVKQYVATGYQEKTRFIATIKEEKEEKNVVTKIVNDVCYAGQRIYMGRRIGKGEVGIHKAYFYP
ncbi:hypothetical protein M1116_01235 [Patescibacteria group bacterium]|nr:hypothetical protein [Patescibacteria group bacterium]